MKKRILSVLLVLVLLFTAGPCAFASAEDTEPFYIKAENHLLNMGYGDMETRTELAVGDTLEVWYFDTKPAEVYIDGEMLYEIPTTGYEFFYYPLKQTGTVEISVKSGEETLATRSFTVIPSGEMYKKVVKQAFIDATELELHPIMTREELEDAAAHGVPIGNPFLPFAGIMMVIGNLMAAIFSFTRIVA